MSSSVSIEAHRYSSLLPLFSSIPHSCPIYIPLKKHIGHPICCLRPKSVLRAYGSSAFSLPQLILKVWNSPLYNCAAKTKPLKGYTCVRGLCWYYGCGRKEGKMFMRVESGSVYGISQVESLGTKMPIRRHYGEGDPCIDKSIWEIFSALLVGNYKPPLSYFILRSSSLAKTGVRKFTTIEIHDLQYDVRFSPYFLESYHEFLMRWRTSTSWNIWKRLYPASSPD